MLACCDRYALRVIVRELGLDDPEARFLGSPAGTPLASGRLLRCLRVVTAFGLVLIAVGFVLAVPLGWIGLGLTGLGVWLRLVLAWADQDEADYVGSDWDTNRW
jgi:hypothetical protein